MTLTRVLLSLGSNLEPRAERIAAAITHLKQHALSDVVSSHVYATEPVGFKDQPEFLNAAVRGETALSAEELFRVCKGIEQTLGRQHREQWHEREIDIDILLFGYTVLRPDNMPNCRSGLVIESLWIPHPRMHERRFVLQPAAEVAADMVHPVFQQTVQSLLTICADKSQVLPV